MCPQPEQPKYKSLKSLSTGKKIIKIEQVEPRSYQPNTNELTHEQQLKQVGCDKNEIKIDQW